MISGYGKLGNGLKNAKNKTEKNSKPLKSWMMLHFRSSFVVEQSLIWRLKKNQIIPIIHSKYFSVSAWLNPGLIQYSVWNLKFRGAGESETQEIPEGRGVGRLTHLPGVNFVSFSTLHWKLLISDLVDHSLIFHIQLELTKLNDSMLWIYKNAP